MESGKYDQKAQSIIQACRDAGSTRSDLRYFLDLEPINLALMETLSRVEADENNFEEVYKDMLPLARKKLVEKIIEIYGLRDSSHVDYEQITRSLLEIEKSGGRQVFEPRTIAGESLIIATLLAIKLHPEEELNSNKIQQYIEENYMTIYEELTDVVKKTISFE